jgi:hypothetical protein
MVCSLATGQHQDLDVGNPAPANCYARLSRAALETIRRTFLTKAMHTMLTDVGVDDDNIRIEEFAGY